MILESTLYLGPAEVLAPADTSGFVKVRFPNQQTGRARLALAMPYAPAAGDEVLVVRQETESAYVIGVLTGNGPVTLRVPGDLNLEAPRGAVRIRSAAALQLDSATGVDITAPRATVRAGRLNLLATTLVQRVASAYTWATGLIQTKSRRLRQVSDEGWFVRAGRAHIKTSDNVSINGKTIHLG